MLLDVLKALADSCRLRLVMILLRGEFTVQELTAILSTGQSRISHHLKILTEAGVLSVKRQGTWSYYSVNYESRIFNAIRPVFELEGEALPDRSNDLAAVAMVLEARRKRSQEFFDQNARHWDDLVKTLLPVPEYLTRLIDSVPHGVVVLEIGTGTGDLLTKLAARAAKVIGVDHSPAMLEEAKQRLAASGANGVELRLGDMTHLPLSDASVGCAVANMVLHHAADPRSVLTEISRVLQPGGTLLLADLARHEREVAREQLADQWLGFEEDELQSWLAAAGFMNICCERVEGVIGQEKVLLVTGNK